MMITKNKKSVIFRRFTFLWGALATLLVFSLTPASIAQQDEAEGHFELPSFEVRPYNLNLDLTLKAPSEVTVPRLRSNLRGTEVRMTFYLDKNGDIYSIGHDASPFDDRESQVGEAMKQCLKSWKFAPAVDKQGKPSAVKIALPVKVVAPQKRHSDKYSSIVLSEPVLLAILDQ